MKLSTETEHSSSSIRQADTSNYLEPSNSSYSSASHLDSDVNRQLEKLSGVDHKPIYRDLEDSRAVNSVSGLPASVKVSENGNCPWNTLTAVAAQTNSTCSSAESLGEVPGSSVMAGNAFSDATGDDGLASLAFAAATVSDDAVGFSAGFSDESKSFVVGITESLGPVTSDQNAPGEMSCFSNMEKSEVYPDDMELASVELNEPDNCCNGIIHGIITDESPKSCLDTPPEKEKLS